MSDKKYPLKNEVGSSEEKNYQYGFNHFFNVGHAQKYGVNAAIVLNHLIYWSKNNYANNRNIYDGYVWTYNSIVALQEILPYFSEKQIRYCLTKLVKNGVIKTGNYNKLSYDKTNWYAIIDKTLLQICQIGVTNLSDRGDKKGEPIPINETNNNTNNINEEETTKTANNADRIISCFRPLSSDSSLDRNPVAIATSQSPLTLGEPKVNSKRKTDKSVLGEPNNAEGVVKQSNTNTNNKNKKTHSPQATTLSNRGFRFFNIVEHNATVSELVTNINKLKIKFDGTYLLENQSFKYLSKILKTGMFEKPVGIAPSALAKKVVSNIRYKIEDLGKTFPSVKSWVTQFSRGDYAYLLSLYEEGGIMTFKGVQRLTKDIISVFLVCGVGEQSFTPEMFFRLKKDNLINDLRVTKTQLPLILELILKGQEPFKDKYFKNELTEEVRPYYTL